MNANIVCAQSISSGVDNISARFEGSQCARRRNSSPECLLQPVCQTRLRRVLATAQCHVLDLVTGSLLETQTPEQRFSMKWPSASIPIPYHRADRES